MKDDRSCKQDRQYQYHHPHITRKPIMHINGACHCGAVSFTAEVDPAKVVICHCTDCQTLSGAAFRAIVPAPLAQFHITGATKTYIKVADSGTRRAQVFCPECGTPLYGSAAENATAVVIRLGCVAERAELKPNVQLWTHSAMPWLDDLATIPVQSTTAIV
jgi:hypothetical protein